MLASTRTGAIGQAEGNLAWRCMDRLGATGPSGRLDVEGDVQCSDRVRRGSRRNELNARLGDDAHRVEGDIA